MIDKLSSALQNSLDDLHGILAFLKLEPLHDKKLFTRTLARPIKQGDPTGIKSLQVGLQWSSLCI